jgi:long-chain acyl-CoA synthetase
MATRQERPAVITIRDESVVMHSYREIASQASWLAYGLIASGISVGESIGLYAPNSPEWVVVSLAVGACGAMVVPIDDMLDEAQAATIIRDSGCRFVFTTTAHLHDLTGRLAGETLRISLLDEEARTRTSGRSWQHLLQTDPLPLPSIEQSAALCLSYTSGTTGAPKAIVLSHENVAANVAAIAGEGEAGPEDRVLLPLPLHHSYPFVIGLLTTLTIGAAVVLPEGISGTQIVRASLGGGATVLIGVPRLYEVMLGSLETRVVAAGQIAKAVFSQALRFAIWSHRTLRVRLGHWLFRPVRAQLGSRLRVLICGGAKLDADVNRKLDALGWRVFAGYGLAETASVFTTNTRSHTRIGSAGRPVGDGEIRIADVDASGVGEILLRGSNVTMGYRNNPEATRAAFTPDGWLRTGDLGYVDPDGYLYVTGRAKEMIALAGGKKVMPEELERIYGASPYICEVAVLERSGALVALVRPDFCAIKVTGAISPDDPIRVWFAEAAQRLPSYQRLADFAITPEPLPRTRLGKYRRFLLPQLYEQARAQSSPRAAKPLSAADRAYLADPTAGKVWEALSRRYTDRPLALDANLAFDLAIDSFDWMAISVELEEIAGVQLSTDEIAGMKSVRDLIDGVVRATARNAERSKVASRPSDSLTQADWLRPTGTVANLVAGVLYALNRLVFRLAFGVQVRGIENLPAHASFVLTPNHASDLDALIVAAALPGAKFRRTYWAGDSYRLFSTAGRRLFCRIFRIFPVDERNPQSAVATASRVLGRGDILVWFPEGWRSPDGQLQRFRPGIGSVLTQTRVLAVPAHIAGSFEAMPRNRSWPRRHPIRVVIGAPVSVDVLDRAGTGRTREERIANALHDRVATLVDSIAAVF